MLRVYLDENRWIDLAQAVNGHPQGERFRTVVMGHEPSRALRSKMMLDAYAQLEQRVQGDYGRSLDQRHRYLGRPMGTWAAASDH